MNVKVSFCIGMFLALCSCAPKHGKVSNELSLSGKNKGELVRVLDHYALDPADSLKYRAALCLIKDMTVPPLASFRNEGFEACTKAVFDSMASYGPSLQISENKMVNKQIRWSVFESVWSHFFSPPGRASSFEFDQQPDLLYISSALLINHIDYAFKAWALPWSREYSFYDFCTYILPYRHANEPLEAWRSIYWDSLGFLRDSLAGETDPVKATILLNNWLGRDNWGSETLTRIKGGVLKPTDFLKGRMCGDCTDVSAMGIFFLRSFGIAVTEISVPAWGKRDRGHVFNAVLSNINGQWYGIDAGGPGPPDHHLTIRPPKVFQNTYEGYGQEENYLRYYENKLDITSQYNKTRDIEIHFDQPAGQKFAYLATFNNTSWTPVMWARVMRASAVFGNMGQGMVYLPLFIDNGKFSYAGDPVLVDSLGNIVALIPDINRRRSHDFTRKYPVDSLKLAQRCADIRGGRFQVSTDPGFKDAVDLFAIDSCTSYLPREIDIHPTKGRYVRYIFPETGNYFQDSPGWIAFFASAKGSGLLEGEYIASQDISKTNLDNMFDKDLLTFATLFPYEKGLPQNLANWIPRKDAPNPFWAGIDLGEELLIDKIGFCPRNDKNNIYPGLSYELMYWNKGWVSLGIKTAKSYTLAWDNIPHNALLILRCLSEGNEERIFTIDREDKVKWW